jgi:MFS family permease
MPAKPTKGHFLFAHQEFQRVPWWKRKNMRTLYIYIIVLIMTNTANGFDGSMMNGLQTLSYWEDYFNHPHGSLLGLFNASMSLGSLLGLFVVPYMIDTWGRRLGCFVGCLIMLLAVGLQSGATGFGMFIAARLLIGFGDCIVLGSAPLLIAEIAHPQDRAILVTLSAASYHSGAFIASWVTLGTLKIQVCIILNGHRGSHCKSGTLFSNNIIFTLERLVMAPPKPITGHLHRHYCVWYLGDARKPSLANEQRETR